MLPARKIRKHKKRPLGRIETEYRYKPPQPVLSCRNVNVDLSGTRTYRAKSTDDIIDEQHRLIQGVYNKARLRNTKSAPTKRTDHRYNVDSSWTTLRFLTVQGLNNSSPDYSIKRQTDEQPQSLLSKRPFTTGSIRAKAKSRTDCYFEPNLYSEIEESSRGFRSAGDLVREQWTPSNHSLDEGKFIRGKNKEGGASLDPRTGNQWLSFGGGDSEESFGVVDAFTDMNKDVFYRIDGATGAHVAKQVRKGDKIRIGRNGSAVSDDPESLSSRFTSNSYSNESVETIGQPSRTSSRGSRSSVPLCWTDQVASSEAKILSPRESKVKPPQKDLNDSKPVVFDEVKGEENWKDYLPKGNGLMGKDLYQIRTRSKPHIGIDGQPSASGKIKNLTIDKSKSGAVEDEVEEPTVEDILEKHLNISSESKNRKPTQYLETIGASPQGTGERDRSRANHGRDAPSARLHRGAGHSPRPGSQQDYSVVPSRSMTPHDIDSLVVRNTSKENKRREKPHTALSGKRSIAPKQPLHKTSAAKGVTFAAGSKGSDTSYIQISQRIPIQQENQQAPGIDPSHSSYFPDDSTSAIHLVQEENSTEYDSSVKDTENTGSLHQTSSQQITPDVEIDEAPDDINLSPSPSPITPYASPKSNQSADVQYTINIPTADLAESDINSVSEFPDKDV